MRADQATRLESSLVRLQQYLDQEANDERGDLLLLERARDNLQGLLGQVRGGGGPEPPQEDGRDHPWAAFDRWHKDHHDYAGYGWPCAQPLRCLWRYTRKTGCALTQEGQTERQEARR